MGMRAFPTLGSRGAHVLRHAAVAGAGAAAVAWLAPPGADLAAHVYQRALFLQHGFALWNNYWYAGRYSFVTYSLVYYPLAAFVGIELLAVVTAAIAGAAFSWLVQREWPAAGHWPARTFSVMAALSVITGAFPYALGLAFGLLSLCALRSRRTWVFVPLVALTFAASPLAFVLLVLLLAPSAVKVPRSRLAIPAAAVVVIGVGAVVLWRLFPDGGQFPFSVSELAATLTFCGLGAAFTWHVPAARVLNRFFAVYALASIVAFAFPSSVGENIARLRFVALPIAVLALALRSWRPVVPATIVLLLAASWNVTPLAFSFARESSDPSANAAYWAPVIRYLEPRLLPSYRVEAVDTAGHWDAVYLPQHGIPIVRGWFRQDDFPQNQVLYSRLGVKAYLTWLRNMGVAYVVITDAPLDYSARGEAALIRNGRSSLQLVKALPHAVIYAVRRPHGIVPGAPGAEVARLGASSMTLSLPRRGAYWVAVRYSPYWHTTAGCLRPRPDGMISLVVPQAGTVQLSFAVTAKSAVDAGIGEKPVCPARATPTEPRYTGPSIGTSGTSPTSTLPSGRRSIRSG